MMITNSTIKQVCEVKTTCKCIYKPDQTKYICEMIYGLQLDCAIVFLVHWHNEAP